MAIKKESLAAIMVRLKLAEDAAKAIELIDAKEEHDLAIPSDLRVYTKTEWDGEGEGKSGVKAAIEAEGKKIGREIAIKDFKKLAGIEIEGKDPEKIVQAFRAKVVADEGLSVDEKVKAAEERAKALKTDLQKAVAERDQFVNKLKDRDADDMLIGLLPKNRDPRFTERQYLTLLRAEIELAEEDGVQVVKRGGQVLKSDKDYRPLAPQAAIADIFTQNKWTADEDPSGQGGGAGAGAAGGRGAGGAGGGAGATPLTGIKSMSQFTTYLSEKQIHPSSEQASKLLAEVRTTNKDFDLTS
jgi:hypothetical protein